MYTNIIAIDPSLSCTALIVNDKKIVYTNNITSKNKNDFKRWFKVVNGFCDIKVMDSIIKTDYSKTEMAKLILYDKITAIIIDDIKNSMAMSDNSIVLIEGYSQSSISGPLVDLVTFSTLLRIKLHTEITNNILIISPLSLKLIAAKLAYKGNVVGKKTEYRNHQNIAGGKFKKNEILLSIIENSNLKCGWSDFLRDNKDILTNLKLVPKPIDDINDAKILYEYGKKI
jgi:hypothetical protein